MSAGATPDGRLHPGFVAQLSQRSTDKTIVGRPNLWDRSISFRPGRRLLPLLCLTIVQHLRLLVTLSQCDPTGSEAIHEKTSKTMTTRMKENHEVARCHKTRTARSTYLEERCLTAAVEQFISCSACKMNMMSRARAKRGWGRYDRSPLCQQAHCQTRGKQPQESKKKTTKATVGW